MSGGLALRIHGHRNLRTSSIDTVVQISVPRLKSALKKNEKFVLLGHLWSGIAHQSLTYPMNHGEAQSIEFAMIIAVEAFSARALNWLV